MRPVRGLAEHGPRVHVEVEVARYGNAVTSSLSGAEFVGRLVRRQHLPANVLAVEVDDHEPVPRAAWILAKRKKVGVEPAQRVRLTRPRVAEDAYVACEQLVGGHGDRHAAMSRERAYPEAPLALAAVRGADRVELVRREDVGLRPYERQHGDAPVEPTLAHDAKHGDVHIALEV